MMKKKFGQKENILYFCTHKNIKSIKYMNSAALIRLVVGGIVFIALLVVFIVKASRGEIKFTKGNFAYYSMLATVFLFMTEVVFGTILIIASDGSIMLAIILAILSLLLGFGMVKDWKLAGYGSMIALAATILICVNGLIDAREDFAQGLCSIGGLVAVVLLIGNMMWWFGENKEE